MQLLTFLWNSYQFLHIFIVEMFSGEEQQKECHDHLFLFEGNFVCHMATWRHEGATKI